MKNKNNLEKEITWLLKEKHNNNNTRDFEKDIIRLKKGEPVDYIIGTIPFLGCEIDLSLRPLIPRTETEFWVEKIINKLKLKKENNRKIEILDIFSGSGCIGISILKHLQNTVVDFGEHDKSFTLQILKNLEKNNINKQRYNIFQSDCFENIPIKKYDYILANPPYVSKERISHIQPSVKQYEPHKALFADDNGLFFIKKLISEGSKYLNKNGILYIEFDSFQKKFIEAGIPKDIYDTDFWKDQFDNWRVVVLTKKS